MSGLSGTIGIDQTSSIVTDHIDLHEETVAPIAKEQCEFVSESILVRHGQPSTMRQRASTRPFGSNGLVITSEAPRPNRKAESDA